MTSPPNDTPDLNSNQALPKPPSTDGPSPLASNDEPGLWARKIRPPRGLKVERFFAVSMLVVVPAYLLWRVIWTMNPEWPIASSLMLLADAMFGLSAIGFALTRLRGDRTADEAPEPASGLSVDVWIPTYNEDLAILRRTVQHALKMDYPHTTYVLDDGARDEVRAMCEQLGARYIARTERSHGKAGNLNHALSRTQGNLIATFDADFVPQRDFLTRLLGHFKNPKVALVQTPQQYYNHDSFQHHRGRTVLWDEQETFFDVTMPGLAAWDAAYWVGTNAILRREAIDDIGGFPTDSLIEDMLTGMSVHAKGYTSLYVKENLAHGLAPAFASQFLTQRLRWAQGAFQILRRHNPLFKAGLSPMQRALYFTSLLHFAEGIPRLIFYALPALVVLFGVAPLQFTPWVALGFGAYFLFSLVASKGLSGGRINLLRGELFAMIRFFPYLRGALAFLELKPLTFVVTAKGGTRGQNAAKPWHLVGPICVFALNLASTIVGMSVLRYLSLDGLNASNIALAVCVAFSAVYVVLAAWAIRWIFTGPSAAGLAFFDWLAFDLTPESTPALQESCIAHRWSDERVIFRSQSQHNRGDNLTLLLKLGADEAVTARAHLASRSRFRDKHGSFEYEAIFHPLNEETKAHLIESVFRHAVRRQALLGSTRGQTHPGLIGETTPRLPNGQRPRRLDFRQFATLSLAVVLLGFAVGAAMTPAGLRPAWVRDGIRVTTKTSRELVATSAPPSTYSTKGTDIIGPDGQPLPTLKGISWFGFETDTYAPHGLWARPMDDILDQIQTLGFNMIRVPYSTAALHQTYANSVSFVANPDLVGLTPIEVMDELIERATDRGLYIMLDRHSLEHRDHRLDDLWYGPGFTEEQLIADWQMLAERYKGIPQILGADIHNEPKGVATWGTGDLDTDWRLAAERIGDAVHEANSDWLIFVEGVTAPLGCDPDGGSDLSQCYWDGGNLSAVREHPVRLAMANKVVYTPHVYGPGLFRQPWHKDLFFPYNLPAVWAKNWSFIHQEGIAPVMIGEFGGPGFDDSTLDGQWKQELVAHIKDNNLSWSYWTLNPNSPDTKGLLLDDWTTVHQGRYLVISDLLVDDPVEDEQPSPQPVLCMQAP